MFTPDERFTSEGVRGVTLRSPDAPRVNAVVVRPAVSADALPAVVFADEASAGVARAAALVDAGRVVAVVDPVFFGAGFDEQSWRYALLAQAAGMRAVGWQIAELDAVAALVDTGPGVELIGVGPRAAFVARLAHEALPRRFNAVSAAGAATLAHLREGRLRPKDAPELFVFNLDNEVAASMFSR